MRITLIINTPDREVAEGLRAEVNRLRELGHEAHPHVTFEGGDARRFARHAAHYGSDLLVSVGGDGTLNEVVNGILDELEDRDGASDAPEPRLAVVPAGTANDFAATLRMPDDLREAIDVALHGQELEIDVGQVGRRRFLNVSTGGIGAEATEESSQDVKRALGPFAYVVTGVRKFVTLEVSEATFIADGEQIHSGRFLVFAVGNGRRTGGGNWLTPRADLGDGLLDVCIVGEVSRVELLRMLPDLRAGEHLDHPAVVYRQARQLRVEAPADLSVNVDGEPISGRRFDYALAAHRLRVMAP